MPQTALKLMVFAIVVDKKGRSIEAVFPSPVRGMRVRRTNSTVVTGSHPTSVWSHSAICSKIWVAAAAARLGVRKVGAPGLMGVAWAKPRALKCFSVPLATVFDEISEMSLISLCVACTVIWALCI